MSELSNLRDNVIHKPWAAKEEVLKKAGITLGKDYPTPIVDHDVARERALSVYQKIRSS